MLFPGLRGGADRTEEEDREEATAKQDREAGPRSSKAATTPKESPVSPIDADTFKDNANQRPRNNPSHTCG
jgi:hypothetical protein